MSGPDPNLHQVHLFCYRLLPILFGATGQPANVSVDDLFPDSLPDLPDEPDLASYHRLGNDIVESHPLKTGNLGFGCSPLSCNGMAKEIAVNQYCLLDDLDNACAVAKRFGVERPESGPCVVIQVLSRTTGR